MNKPDRDTHGHGEPGHGWFQTQFGDRVYSIRTSRRLTQKEVSTAAGIARSNLSNIERGDTNVTLTTVVKIAAALGVSERTLLFGDEITGLTYADLSRVVASIDRRLTELSGTHSNRPLTADAVVHLFDDVRSETRRMLKAALPPQTM